MADTVDHDDLAEQVAGAPNELHELGAGELRQKVVERLCEIATTLHDARGCLAIGATSAAKERITTALQAMVRVSRELAL